MLSTTVCETEASLYASIESCSPVNAIYILGAVSAEQNRFIPHAVISITADNKAAVSFVKRGDKDNFFILIPPVN